MPETNELGAQIETVAASTTPKAEPKKSSPTLGVMMNPEDAVAVSLEPVFISLGLKPTSFKPDVGGSGC